MAILDIDDVIAIIRSSDDVAQARERLIAAFELSEIQSNYILDMPLRRLTKFSRLELESERDKLHATIAELTEILDNPDQLRALVGNELAEIAQQHGTPRRTILLAASGVATTATAAPLEVTDDPCWVLLSSAGLLARTDHADPLPAGGTRANHDVLTSKVITTARGECGLVTSAGRLLKISVLDLPTVPATAAAPNLQGGTHVSELITLDPDERVLCLTSLSPDSLGLALGTAGGVVKRVNPEVLARDSWEVIRLEPGDKVVGAVELRSLDTELVFVTNDAQLLRFPAGTVRPQGRSGGGMAGIKLGDRRPGGVLRSRSGDRVRRRDGVWHVPGTARHRCRLSQGHAHRGVPGQRSSYRRRTLPSLPQGRGRAASRLGGTSTRGSRRGEWQPDTVTGR